MHTLLRIAVATAAADRAIAGAHIGAELIADLF